MSIEFFSKDEIIARMRQLKVQFSQSADTKDEVRANLNLALVILGCSLFGQKLKSGKDYGEHPLHVGMSNTESTAKKIIGFLHDVVEDSEWTLPDLAMAGFSDRIVEGVESLTKQRNEPYFDFIERCSTNDDGIGLKLKDIKHNSDQSRTFDLLTEKDIERINKYKIAYAYLLAVKKGEILKGSSLYEFVDDVSEEFKNQREAALLVVSKHSSNTAADRQQKIEFKA